LVAVHADTAHTLPVHDLTTLGRRAEQRATTEIIDSVVFGTLDFAAEERLAQAKVRA
jgi:hypothetical protein